jgi:hypothetical protein
MLRYPLLYRCLVCDRWNVLPSTWPDDRDLLEFLQEHPTYVPPCGHPPDPDNLSVGVSFLPRVGSNAEAASLSRPDV